MRLHGNAALTAALAGAESVVPLFVLDPVLLDAPDLSEKRLAFLLQGLRKLDTDLNARGSRLIVRHGDPVQELTSLMAETDAVAVFAERDPWPYAVQRDQNVSDVMPTRMVNGLTVHAPGVVVKQDGSPYTVFTPFSRRWKAEKRAALDASPAPDVMPPVSEDLSSEHIPPDPQFSGSLLCKAGEAEARRQLETFMTGEDARVHRYSEGRNRLDWDGTSQLSPYLRFGMLSTAEAVAAAERAIICAPDAASRKGAETWLDELIWREFFMSILFHFPSVLEQSFRQTTRAIRWSNDEEGFARWKEGRTGYPVVDAAMRQLQHTGWMHNRARMIVASFLCKHLLIDWRWGEQHFMQNLVDGDPASNNGGWQWTAGTGTDAAPYFRVFNPVLQGQKHDPQGSYVRRWLPELQDVPSRYIHRPWTMPQSVQSESGCTIGSDYPAPIVDHKIARQRALDAYAAARN